MVEIYLSESGFTVFNRSDEGEFCDVVELEFGMVMAGDHLSHLSSNFSFNGNVLPFVAKIPDDVGVAMAIPPMMSDLRDSVLKFIPNSFKSTLMPPAFQNFESACRR